MQVSKTTNVVTKRNFTLKELVEGVDSLKSQIEEGSVSEDVYDLHLVAKNLLSGMVDKVGRYRDGILAHKEACEKQIEHLDWILSQIDKVVNEAVNLSDEKKLVGSVYSAKEKKNPPSVIISNEGEIPLEYKNITVELKDKFSTSDISKYNMYRDFVLQRQITTESPMTNEEQQKLSEYVSVSVDKKSISKDLKANKTIPGAFLKQDTRVVFEAGKSNQMVLEG